MLDFHPTIVENEGVPVYVVLPYAEFKILQNSYLSYSQEIEAEQEWEALLNNPKSKRFLNNMRAKIAKDRTNGTLSDLLTELANR
ncbi:MAG: hypothetical protein KIH69_019765 [Anaerolineae bacterium]|nr:hypothetical protein [Anaerolineae bacterium]